MIDQFWTFLGAITLLTLMPGIDSLLVVRNAARGGWRDGLITSTGICSGLFVHAMISALGVSALLRQSAFAFGLMRLLGGGYLVWLGLVSLSHFWRPASGTMPTPEAGSRQPLMWQRSLREGLVSNLFNPKTLLFYLAFLPQFINPQRSVIAQALLMAAIHFVIAMIYQGALAILVERVQCFFGKSRLRFSDLLIGVLLIYLGIKFLMVQAI